MHAFETWFPFSIQICLNGREWLAQTMRQQGIGFQKQDNGFVWVEDWAAAQRLLDEQLKPDWPKLLDGIARGLNPRHEEMFARLPARLLLVGVSERMGERCRVSQGRGFAAAISHLVTACHPHFSEC
jgi:hypothetical protein